MKKYKLLTNVEKLSMTDEEIKGSIILQCAGDGVPYPAQPDLQHVSEVPKECSGTVRYKPVLKWESYYSDTLIPIFFDTAEEAINFVKDSGAKYGISQDSNIIGASTPSISARSEETYANAAEKSSQERTIILQNNEKSKEANSEIMRQYEKEQGAFEKESEELFEEYYQLVHDRNNLELLNREYLQYLELCDNNEDITKKVFCNARPSANFEAIKNFKRIEPKQTSSTEKKS